MRPGKRRPLQQLPQRQLPRHRPHRLLLPEFRSDRREIRCTTKLPNELDPKRILPPT